MNSVEKILEEIKALKGFVSTDLVAIESGQSLGGGAIREDFDHELASREFAEVTKTVQASLKALQVGKLMNAFYETKLGYLITHVCGDGKYYLGIALTKPEADVKAAHKLAAQLDEKLLEAVPKA